jgi:hypothetical protein
MLDLGARKAPTSTTRPTPNPTKVGCLDGCFVGLVVIGCEIHHSPWKGAYNFIGLV